VLKTGGRWRDCPDAYGPHTTVYNRYNRWSRRGFWRAHAGGAGRGRLDRGDGGLGLDLRQGAPLRAWRQRGAKAQAIGPSRGGQTTKVHVLTDVLGRPAVIHLTPGNASDVKIAPEVLAAAPGRLKRLIADRGYDANHLRRDLRAARTTPIIPGRRSRKRPIQHDKRRYKERWRIEAAFAAEGLPARGNPLRQARG
jgi:transposase